VDTLTFIAALAKAIAWPTVVLVGARLFRPEVGRLLDRLKEGGPVKLYPPPQVSTAGGGTPGTTSLALASLDHRPPIPAVEQMIRAVPEIAAADASGRELLLINALARAVLYVRFEQVEGLIYGSQIALLEHLNAAQAGLPLSQLKEMFYDPMVRATPKLAGYPFDGVGSYMGFLRVTQLVEGDGEVARITETGRFYLVWRLEQKKPLKTL